jgi:hypothetical protein
METMPTNGPKDKSDPAWNLVISKMSAHFTYKQKISKLAKLALDQEKRSNLELIKTISKQKNMKRSKKEGNNPPLSITCVKSKTNQRKKDRMKEEKIKS